MLSQLDNIIYPDRCEVVEVQPSQRYVYIIFKNGHSSLLTTRLNNKWKVLINEQIYKIRSIDVILRDPQSRMLSGINTYVQNTLKQQPDLDRDTVIWFAKNYLFLNRHYATQFSWLLNLARFMHPDTRLNFFGMEDLSLFTSMNLKPVGISEPSEDLIQAITTIPDFEMFRRLDQTLCDCIGKSMSFAQLLHHIQDADSKAYDFTIGKILRVIDPLYALSKT